MFQEQLTKLEPDKTEQVLSLINPKLESGLFEPAETTILSIDLPFYPGWEFFDIADYGAAPPRKTYALHEKQTGNIVLLDWSNQPIYELNKHVPIKLDKEIVPLYVRFFFTHVRGKHGRFGIVENVDDIAWKEDPPPAARRAIGKMLFPITFQKQTETGEYHLKACMTFKDSLFKADIFIDPTGQTRLANEELLIEDMPVLDDMFGQ